MGKWCVVADNEDPLARGRIKVLIPGLSDLATAYWIKAVGLGGDGRQCKAPALDRQVFVLWEDGSDPQDPSASAVYLEGHYFSNEDGTSQGPDHVFAAADAAGARKRATVYESSKFVIGVTEESTTLMSLVIQEKISGSKIEIDAATAGGESPVIRIEARGGIRIHANGPVNITSDLQLSLQGRVVSLISGSEI